jgi:two-component system cell cycle response regulator
MMSELDGFEVCRRIKQDPATAPIRVIALTGHPSPENVQRITAAGAEICLAKPIDNAELFAVLGLTAAGQNGNAIAS